jgi:hypothetical protein
MMRCARDAGARDAGAGVLEGIRGERSAREALGLVDADQDSATLDQPHLDSTRHGLAAAGDVA